MNSGVSQPVQTPHWCSINGYLCCTKEKCQLYKMFCFVSIKRNEMWLTLPDTEVQQHQLLELCPLMICFSKWINQFIVFTLWKRACSSVTFYTMLVTCQLSTLIHTVCIQIQTFAAIQALNVWGRQLLAAMGLPSVKQSSAGADPYLDAQRKR